MDALRKLGVLGDANPIERGGGVVYGGNGHKPFVEYTHGAEIDGSILAVFRVDIGDDIIGERDWVSPEAVCKLIGAEANEWRELGRSCRILDRARMIEDIASLVGWENLDQHPLRLTRRELEKRWKI